MNEQINLLTKHFPLATSWSDVELFQDKVSIADITFEMIGFSSQKNEKTMVTGSAAACSPFKNDLLERAYFELLERSAVIDYLADHKNDGETYRYSKSNGVAIHTSLELAKKAAKNELIERDALLRSWFQNEAPERIYDLPFEIQNLVDKLEPYYSFEFYLFHSSLSIATNSFVTASFAFPKDSKANFCYGFSCRSTLPEALRKSFLENLQSLTFLWGESFDEELNFSPTPSFHQAYFATEQGLESIKHWLHQKNKKVPCLAHVVPDFKYEDITPEHLKGVAFAVKATEPHALLLIFGKGYTLEQLKFSPERHVHPIC